jgi:DNA polymerase
MMYGAPLSALSRCIRSFFVAPPGRILISGDWSNVEGRGQAWFAGEQWKLKAFEAADAKQGPGIYELAYSRMMNVPVESVKNPSEERQIGKVSELAFGYQGGKGSFRTMAKNFPEMSGKFSDEKADEFKIAWRAAHPRITQCWRDIQDAALDAVRNPGETFSAGYPARQCRYRMVGSFLWCLLPSGRAICYPYPKLLAGPYGDQLTYMTVPSQEDKKKGKVIDDPKNASNWARVGTYGGSLFNNIVQGFARDLLVDSMLVLDGMGAQIVLHTHDSISNEVGVQTSEAALSVVRNVMQTIPDWAAGFPLKADCCLERRFSG